VAKYNGSLTDKIGQRGIRKIMFSGKRKPKASELVAKAVAGNSSSLSPTSANLGDYLSFSYSLSLSLAFLEFPFKMIF
jgi:hypothetical protein